MPELPGDGHRPRPHRGIHGERPEPHHQRGGDHRVARRVGGEELPRHPRIIGLPHGHTVAGHSPKRPGLDPLHRRGAGGHYLPDSWRRPGAAYLRGDVEVGSVVPHQDSRTDAVGHAARTDPVLHGIAPVRDVWRQKASSRGANGDVRGSPHRRVQRPSAVGAHAPRAGTTRGKRGRAHPAGIPGTHPHFVPGPWTRTPHAGPADHHVIRG